MDIMNFTEYLVSHGFNFSKWDKDKVTFTNKEDTLKVDIKICDKDPLFKCSTYTVSTIRKEKCDLFAGGYSYTCETDDTPLSNVFVNSKDELVVPYEIRANFFDHSKKYILDKQIEG